jgi:hypothetical protein
MGKRKEPNEGSLPCMVCVKPQNYLNTAHMRTHSPGEPQSIPDYREWVAEKSSLGRSHPAISSNQLLKPQLWRENKHLFEGWRDWK